MGGQPYPDIDTNDLTGLLQQEYMMPRPENCEPQLYVAISHPYFL